MTLVVFFIIMKEELGELVKAAGPGLLWSCGALFPPAANSGVFISDWGMWTTRIHFKVWTRSKQSVTLWERHVVLSIFPPEQDIFLGLSSLSIMEGHNYQNTVLLLSQVPNPTQPGSSRSLQKV